MHQTSLQTKITFLFLLLSLLNLHYTYLYFTVGNRSCSALRTFRDESLCSNFLKTIWKKCYQSKKVNRYLFICLVQKNIVHMVNKIISLERILLLLEVNHLILFFQPQRPKYRRLQHQAVFCLLREWIPRGPLLLVVESISNVTIIWILFIFLHTVSNFIVFLTKLLISVIQFHKQQMCPYKIHLVIQSIYTLYYAKRTFRY